MKIKIRLNGTDYEGDVTASPVDRRSGVATRRKSRHGNSAYNARNSKPFGRRNGDQNLWFSLRIWQKPPEPPREYAKVRFPYATTCWSYEIPKGMPVRVGDYVKVSAGVYARDIGVVESITPVRPVCPAVYSVTEVVR